MSNTIITKDGRHHYINRDTHFQDLIREYMGDDAAEWYEDRIKPFTGIHTVIRRSFPNLLSIREFNRALDQMTEAEYHHLMALLSECRGWDE